MIALLELYQQEKLTIRNNNSIFRRYLMRDNYDFSKSIKNPYFDRVKQEITIPLDEETLNYFKKLAQENGIPYQNLIRLYLFDCAKQQRKLSLTWS